jgi:8-oxo-dGTP pyrophosphatase MutT (NUDIX family)
MPAMRVMRHDCAAIQEVSLILMKDGKVCLLRRANTGYQDGKYCFPAGHKEPGETPAAGAIREAFEESGVRVDPASVRHAHTMHRMCHGRIDDPDHERIAYFFVADAWEGEPANVEEAKCDHLDWFAFDALPDMVPYMRDALEHVRAGRPYSESTH